MIRAPKFSEVVVQAKKKKTRPKRKNNLTKSTSPTILSGSSFISWRTGKVVFISWIQNRSLFGRI